MGVDGSASNDANAMLAEARQAMLLARLQMGLLPPEGPRTLLSTSDPLRADEWMTAREVLGIATRGGADVLGRSDIGALELGRCADFFTLDLNQVAFAGGLSDPVAATLFCLPPRTVYTVVNGHVIVDRGELVTLDLAKEVAAHNRNAARLMAEAG